MQKFKYTTIGHTKHKLCCPLTEGRVDEILSYLTNLQSNLVLDIGCGKGFFLLKLSKNIATIGHGVDLNPFFIDEAINSSAAQIDAKLLSFQCADINKISLDNNFGAIACLGSTQSYNGFYETLAFTYEHLCENGIAIISDAYKLSVRSHSKELLLPCFLQGCRSQRENIQKAKSLGFRLISTIESAQFEWDIYETKFYESISEFFQKNPSDSDAI